MKGSLEILEILMCLDDKLKNATPSSTIRERLKNHNPNTLNSRLDRLSHVTPKIIEKVNRKEIGEKIKPGGDKIKYKLTKEGARLKDQLIKQSMNILLLDPEIKKEILGKILTSNELTDIINEFSKELESLEINPSGKELGSLKKRLRSILNNHLT